MDTYAILSLYLEGISFWMNEQVQMNGHLPETPICKILLYIIVVKQESEAIAWKVKI